MLLNWLFIWVEMKIVYFYFVFKTYFWAVKYILTKVAAQGSKLATEKTVSKLFPVVSDVNGGGGDWTSAGTVTGFVLRRHSWYGGCFISELSSEIFLKRWEIFLVFCLCHNLFQFSVHYGTRSIIHFQLKSAHEINS